MEQRLRNRCSKESERIGVSNRVLRRIGVSNRLLRASQLRGNGVTSEPPGAATTSELQERAHCEPSRGSRSRFSPFSPEIAAPALGGRSASLEGPAVSAGSGLQRTTISTAATAAAVPEA